MGALKLSILSLISKLKGNRGTHRDEAARVFTVEEDYALQRTLGEVKECSVEGGDDRWRCVVHHCLRHVLEGAGGRGTSTDVADHHLVGPDGEEGTRKCES